MYEERVVAFVDLLGFSSAVERSKNDLFEQNRIRDCLNSLQPQEFLRHPYVMSGDAATSASIEIVRATNARLLKDHPIEISYFSDCVVLSTSASDSVAAVGMVELLSRVLTQTLVVNGFALRGGLAIGKMFHRDGLAFGPAMVRAHELEGVADVPRILVDQYCYESFAGIKQWSIWESLFHADHDSIYMSLGAALVFAVQMSPTRWYEEAESSIARANSDFLRAVERCENALAVHKSESIQEKYNWLLRDLEAVRRTLDTDI